MARKPDIIFLETRTQRIKRRWKGMSRIGRLGVISIVFGAIGFLTCWLFSILQFVSVPFSMIGLMIGLLATILGFVNNEKLYGFWLPLAGLVLSAIGLAVAATNYRDAMMKQRQIAEQNSPAKQLVGLWELENSTRPTYLNFTKSGSVVFTQILDLSLNDGKGRAVDRLARYDVERMKLVLMYGRRSTDQHCDFQFQLINGNRLVLDHFSEQCREFELVGSWKLISDRQSVDSEEVVDEELAEYQRKLDGLKREQARFQKSLNQFTTERKTILEKLQPYEEGGQQPDDAWEVHARDLKIIVDQIEVIERRLPRLEAAIVRLESAIGNRIRQAQMDKLGLSDDQLRELLRIALEVDDELKSKADLGPVADLELQRVISEQLDQVDRPTEDSKQ